MNNIKKAEILFNEQHFHCSQAVFGAFAEDLGLSEDIALRIGGCFGSGMNEGEVCGCVTGALMALGLKFGQSSTDDYESREKSRAVCMEFYDRFRAENGSCICRELLRYDFGKVEDTAKLRETKIYLDICPKLIKSAAKITKELIYD